MKTAEMSSVKILLVVVLCCTLVYSQNDMDIDTEHKQGKDSSEEHDDYNNYDNGSEWWIILLGVLGGIALLLVVFCTIYCCCCHKKKTSPVDSVAQVNDNAAYDVKIGVNVAPPPPYAISRSGSMVKVAPYDGPPAGDPPGYGASSVPPPPYLGKEYSTIQV